MKSTLFCLALFSFYQLLSVDGWTIPIEEAPWMVIVERDGKTEILGSIVGKDLVVSATRSIEFVDPSNFVVRAGSAKVGSGGSTHNITKIVTHPFASRGYYDVGVFRVDPPFQLDKTRQIIEVNRTAPLEPQAAITYFNDDGDLEIMQLTLWENEICSKWFELLGGIAPDQACAKSNVVGDGPCDDDFGTGIIQHGELIGALGQFPICNHLTVWPLVYSNFSDTRMSMWLEANIP